jgi:imidazolonepropionase-like amidohydrolase
MLAAAIAKETDAKDHIKIVNSGLNSLLCFGKQTTPQFTLEEMTDAVAAAERRNLKVMVHANGKMPVEIAVEAGCCSIEHGFFMGEDNLKKMADRQVFWVPTAFTMKAFSEHLRNSGQDTDVPRRNLDHQMEQIASAKRFGVPVAAGTDAGSLGVHHGSGIIDELKLFMAAGFSIQEAVRSATALSVELLGLEDVGRLMPGAAATFIATPGDPSYLPESLDRINAFYINGTAYCQDQKT